MIFSLATSALPHGVDGDAQCGCGRSWQSQLETLKEMGIYVHSVIHDRHPLYNHIASETRGLYLNIAGADGMMKLVKALAENDLDKQRIMVSVEEALGELADELRLLENKGLNLEVRVDLLREWLRKKQVSLSTTYSLWDSL